MAIVLRRQAGQKTSMRRAGEQGPRAEYLAFALAGEGYAVPIGCIAEILKPPPMTEVPRAPRSVMGIVSVRGRLVTVIDMRRRLRLAEAPFDRKTRILIADVGIDEPMGLLVDEVLEVVRLSDSEIEAAQAIGGDQATHIAGIARQGDMLLVLLDLKPLVTQLV